MAVRAEAIRAEGEVAACQRVHLGRETPGAETWLHRVAPSSVRSPRSGGTRSVHAIRSLVIGDAVVQRRAGHAIAEGRAVGEAHFARTRDPCCRSCASLKPDSD